MSEENNTEKSKTIYFLGAGAFAGSDFKLPVMQGFFREEDFPGEYPNLKEYLEKLYPNTELADVNVESVMTHLELTLEGFNWGLVDSSLLETKKQLFSLNYDLIVDNIINREDGIQELKDFYARSSKVLYGYQTWIGPRISQPPKEKGKGLFIKLHGSLNWAYCPSSNCPNNKTIWPWDASADPCIACGTQLENVIIPPTMKKSLEKFPKLGFLWHLAFNELKAADRIISIGMSLTDSDYYLKWLIRQAMIERQRERNDLPELVIANPCPDDRKKCSNVFGITPSTEFLGLKEYNEGNMIFKGSQ